MNSSLSTIYSIVMCRLNDGFLVASYRSELRAVAVAKLERSLPPYSGKTP